MSKQANKTLIGAFVVGAIALVVAGLLIFGSGKFFTKKIKNVLFFEGSVKGLSVGAPVMFRGVKIGEVTDIVFSFDPKNLSILIPVYIEIDPDKVTVIGGMEEGVKYYLNQLIEKGLRAQLQLQSIVTGQLMINLDFYPDKPIRLVGIEKRYPEIPTIPTSLEELTKTLQDLPVREVFSELRKSIEGINKFVNSPALMGSIESLNRSLMSLESLSGNIDTQLSPTISNIQSATEAARDAFREAEKALSTEKGVPAQIGETLKVTRDTLKQAEQTLLSIQDLTAQNVHLSYEINRTLKELSASARSLRLLADYLERHPEALLRGKKSSKGE